jgi:hypothetical protein
MMIEQGTIAHRRGVGYWNSDGPRTITGEDGDSTRVDDIERWFS